MKKILKWFFISILTIIALGVPTIYLIILNSPSVSATWYDDSWGYRQAVTVTVTSSASDVANSQTIISVNTSTLGSKLQSACQDLRFTNTNGKLLPYYLASSCNNSSTTGVTIWVLVDLVPKNTTTYTMYMYYGNPGASAGSDSSKFSLYTGLVGYWPMDEASWNGTSGEVIDSSGSGNHGTALTPSGPTTAAGKFGNGGSFDGSNDYVNVTHSSSLNISGALTIAAWVYNNAINDPSEYVIKWSTGNYWFLRVRSTSNNKFEFTPSAQSSEVGRVNSVTQAQTGVWYHVVGTYDGSTSRIYVNGVLENSVNFSGGIDTNNAAVTIGALGQLNPAIQFVNGQIDDVRIYNRALSATDVSQLYNTSQPTTSFATEEKAPSPIAYWKFNDGQGTNAQDSTTTNADGTLAGTTVPTWQTEDQCISGKCLYFDGLTSKVTVSKVLPSVQTVSMWVKPNTSASTALIDLDGGTHKITTDSSSVISASGFDTPTIYVNGKVSTTLTANSWNYVTITTATSFASTSSLTIGLTGSTYFKGFIDEVKIYPYARSSAQILADYNSRGGIVGSSADIGSSGSLSNGLVGYWKMDEGSWNGTSNEVVDTSGNGNHGTAAGTTKPTTGTGKFGNGGSFSATTQAVTINNAIISGATGITHAAWIKRDGSSTGQQSIISAGATFLILNSSNEIKWWSDTFVNPATVSYSFTTGTWYHIAVTQTGRTYTIYVNGAVVASGTSNNTLNTASECSAIGNYPCDSSRWWGGTLDEVRTYKRALSPSEVSALYNFAPGPKVYLKMDEGTGTSANDSSGNSNNGTVNTGTWSIGKYGKGVGVSGSTGSDVSVPDFSY